MQIRLTVHSTRICRRVVRHPSEHSLRMLYGNGVRHRTSPTARQTHATLRMYDIQSDVPINRQQRLFTNHFSAAVPFRISARHA